MDEVGDALGKNLLLACYGLRGGNISTGKEKTVLLTSDPSLSSIKEIDHKAERSRWVNALQEQSRVLCSPDSCQARELCREIRHPCSVPWGQWEEEEIRAVLIWCVHLMWGVDREEKVYTQTKAARLHGNPSAVQDRLSDMCVWTQRSKFSRWGRKLVLLYPQ